MHYYLTYILTSIALWSCSSFSMSWQDLWWRKDQQAMMLLKQGQYVQAAHTFVSPAWTAVANYRAKNYSKSAQILQTQTSATAKYNLGNALALQHKYTDAINAYDQALELEPTLEDAIYNRELIRKLMQQQPTSSNNNNTPNENNAENNNNTQPKSKEQDQDSKNKNADKKDNTSNQNEKNNEESNQKTQESSPQQQNSSTQPQETTKSNAHQNSTSSEKQQAPLDHAKEKMDQETDQWLEQIADDPGDLLKRKIMRDHLKKIHAGEES